MLVLFGYRDDFYKEVYQFYSKMIERGKHIFYGEYMIEAYKELQLMMKKNYRKDEVLQFLLKNQDIISFYIEYANLLEAEGKTDEAIEYLVDGKEKFIKRGQEKQINQFLFELYKETRQYEKLIDLSAELIDYYDMDYYFELKKVLPETLWLKCVDQLISMNQDDDEFIARVFEEERRYSELLEIIKRKIYLITEYNDCFGSELQEERKQLFESYIYEEFAKANTRKQYRRIAKDVKAYYLAFKEDVINIISLLIEKYPKRPAMADELYKVRISLKRKLTSHL